ncbi:hypothetical protein VTN00DRAFT_2253 [Thermoascus crustaceus]|uniref:uncharacterized protein n=1 Tax=Thermoascus crustaceus TaxID=5088 RepID=UPI0037432078
MLTLWHHVSRTCVAHGAVCLAALVRGLQAPSLLLTRYRLPEIFFHRGSAPHLSANGARPLCRPDQPGSHPRLFPRRLADQTPISFELQRSTPAASPAHVRPTGQDTHARSKSGPPRTEQSSWNLSQATGFDWSHHLRHYFLSPWR